MTDADNAGPPPGSRQKELPVIKRRSTSTLVVSAAAILLIAVAAACGSSHTSSPTAARSRAPATTAPPAPPAVAVGSSGLGNILVDSQGRTVYMFGADSGTTSACTGACAAAWPPVQAMGTPTAGNGANAALVAATSRSDGTSQVTYNGHPLYTFTGDHQTGDTNGQGLVAFGGTWSALSPAGVQISPAPPVPSPTTAPPAPAPPPTTQSAPPPKPAPQAPRVPQNGGGDGDADNRGGPDDGDGGV
jgi:predicted lipoprotein with Yx(FWY)xxD motif